MQMGVVLITHNSETNRPIYSTHMFRHVTKVQTNLFRIVLAERSQDFALTVEILLIQRKFETYNHLKSAIV
jgi:hypothetical protein